MDDSINDVRGPFTDLFEIWLICVCKFLLSFGFFSFFFFVVVLFCFFRSLSLSLPPHLVILPPSRPTRTFGASCSTVWSSSTRLWLKGESSDLLDGFGGGGGCITLAFDVCIIVLLLFSLIFLWLLLLLLLLLLIAEQLFLRIFGFITTPISPK